MPRVKIDYVVSFSSESPEAPASNLLANEAGRGRWLCAQGEPSCSVLLQLPKAVQISSITIGAHLSALVEVLVGRSETPNDQFQVLIASSVFLSPSDSRKVSEGDSAADRVRSFNSDQLAGEVRDKKWDRVRVVCSQPYNKHCKYGLSFIHIFSPEGDSGVSQATASRVPTKAALKLPFTLSPQDSDDDDLKPGALFAQHLAQKQAQESHNTDAQIRQATSQALKKQSDSSTKLVRTPISKPRRNSGPTDQSRSDRTRDSLMYAEEDDKPNDKIDRLVAAHKEQQAKSAEKASKDEKHHKEKDKASKPSRDKNEAESTKHRKERSKDESTIHTPKEKDKDNKHDHNRNRDESRKSRDDSHKGKDNSHRNRDDFNRSKDDSHRNQSDSDKSKDASHRNRSDSDKSKDDSHRNRSNSDRSKDVSIRKHRDEDKNKTPESSKRERSSSIKHGKDEERSSKKQETSPNQDSKQILYAGPVSDTPHTLLSDVVFVLSGYENPRRAQVRDAALAMGASFQRDWGPHCTHLICAFPNTPKLKSVRSSPDGDKAIVVTADWIERCAARQRRLPWQWFATEAKFKVQRARSASGEDPPGTSLKADSPKKIVETDCDTDDEIERVMKANAKKRQRTLSSDDEESTSPSKKVRASKDETANSSHESDVAFVKDERVQGNVTVSDSDSDATDKIEDTTDGTQELDSIKSLPAFFEGFTFALCGERAAAIDETLLRRYVRAYGGDIVHPQEDEDLEVDYILCLSGDARGARAKGRLVRGDWVWKCHERQKLCSPREFAIM